MFVCFFLCVCLSFETPFLHPSFFFSGETPKDNEGAEVGRGLAAVRLPSNSSIALEAPPSPTKSRGSPTKIDEVEVKTTQQQQPSAPEPGK